MNLNELANVIGSNGYYISDRIGKSLNGVILFVFDNFNDEQIENIVYKLAEIVKENDLGGDRMAELYIERYKRYKEIR